MCVGLTNGGKLEGDDAKGVVEVGAGDEDKGVEGEEPSPDFPEEELGGLPGGVHTFPNRNVPFIGDCVRCFLVLQNFREPFAGNLIDPSN